MSKIKCRCGNILPDITDNIRYKGYIIYDMEQFELFDLADEMIESKNPQREALAMTFRRNIGVGERYIRLKEMYQCPLCGRMIIETSPGEFCFFMPEEHHEKNLLDYGTEIEKRHIYIKRDN